MRLTLVEMKPFLVILFTLNFFASGYLFSQVPVVQWQRTYGGNSGDYPRIIRATSDGGYIVAGYTEGITNGDVMGYHGNVGLNDYWIVKLDAAGNIQWQKCLGGPFFDAASDVKQTPDGGYIIAGQAASRTCDVTGNHGGTDYWIVKLAPNGDVMWEHSYGGSDNEYGYAIDLTSDGGYVVTGFTQSSNGDVTVNHGDRDVWVIKIDATGNLIWQKSIGGSGDDEGYAIRSTSDGGCITAGYVESTDADAAGNHGKRDFFLVKLDNTGNVTWKKCLGGSGRDEAWSIQTTPDGGYIAAGRTASNDGDVSGNHWGIAPFFEDYWVVKLDNTGNIQWQKCYGGDNNDEAYYVQLTPDGGYVVTGFAESNNGDLSCNASVPGTYDAWTIKLNSTGAIEWKKVMGGNYYDVGFCVQPLSDGSYILAGETCSSDVSGYHKATNGSCSDYWIVKLSAPVITPPAPVVTILPATGNACAGASNTFTASVLYGGTNPTYQWKRNGIAVGTNSPVYTASDFANNDMLVCTVTSGGGCDPVSLQSSGTMTVKLNSSFIQPQITISASNTAICSCSAITFKASVVNGGPSPLYRWQVNGANTDGNNDVYISKSLQGGDQVTCVYTDTAACVTGGSSTSNIIQMTSGGAQPASVSISASSNTICSGTPVTFTAASSNAGASPSYQWKVNGTNAGTNNNSFVSSTLVNGDVVTCSIHADPLSTCTTTTNATSNAITMVVSNKGNPSLAINASANIICAGQSVTFTATPTNAGANPSYQWMVNGSNAGANTSSFTSSTLTNGDVVNCLLTVDPLFSCANLPNATSNNIVAVVKNQPEPTATITASVAEACAGSNINFNADVQNAGSPVSYQWLINNLPANNGDNPVFNSNTLENGDQLTCMITPGSGACSLAPVQSNTIIAAIDALPVVHILPADTTIVSGKQVKLTVVGSSDINTFAWSPSDKLQDPLTLSPTTVSLTEGVTYSLVVESSKGCQATATAIVIVGRLLNMPNAFSPNGDGKNDVFRIPPNSLINLKEFSVFDRWGNKVFSTSDSSIGWDGNYKGEPANAGTYVYMINGTNYKGNIAVRGSVVLVR